MVKRRAVWQVKWEHALLTPSSSPMNIKVRLRHPTGHEPSSKSQGQYLKMKQNRTENINSALKVVRANIIS